MDSTNKCNRDVFEPMWLHAKKYLGRGSVAKAFSGFIIERESQILERGIRHLSEVRFLGESSADETIGVLIGASLPGAVGVGKVEYGLEFCRNILMPGKLGPVVRSDRVNAMLVRRQSRHGGGHGGLGAFRTELVDEQVAGIPIIDGE